MTRNGRLWVAGLLVLGSISGLFAVWHWSRPDNAVRWTFTQFHTSLMSKGKRLETARQIAADRVVLDGLPMTRDDFLSAYVVPAQPGELHVAPCPGAAGHWAVGMSGRAWCFAPEGRAWKLHRIGPTPCDEK